MLLVAIAMVIGYAGGGLFGALFSGAAVGLAVIVCS